ncbi:hypothetical protein [Ktedonospora formicarum]|uniref:Uncharacterized protein n=1 Tax=Ktedonospora formicarum TaxID=2778364 RepID=A0A8J3I0L5_9CHLR|nr:hypothetical protein [Ktedonospora formicarum]GHO42699.1 hypothetical protein KSX_08620 [Ktedonospora formicarum]
MAISSKAPVKKVATRMWHTPTSKAALYWFLFAAAYTALFYILYLILLHEKGRLFHGPFFDVVFRCGVMSYIMILGVAAYSLRARFFHGLPWKAQNWVWAHIWVGIASVLLALLHGDFRYILHFDCAGMTCVTDKYLALPSLYGLIFLVLSGGIGRLLDAWQTKIIAHDASTNGVGIAKAIPGRLSELEYVIERLNAGKSEAFKVYCERAITSVGLLSADIPELPPQEHADFHTAHTALAEHARLLASLNVQMRARQIFKLWRRVHMVLVPLILLIISFHAIAELIRVLLGMIHTMPL